jgi:competence protein ComEC
LKVPHHGSRYSTGADFIDLTDPEIAVIEVGRNSYGHPSPETLERLDAYGAITFRTDRDGTVRFVSDGKTYRVFAERRAVSYIGEKP